MKKMLSFGAVALACCLLLAQPARAAFDTTIDVKVGDTVRFTDTLPRSGGGGPFFGTVNPASANTWAAYCVEGGGGPVEYIAFGTDYKVKSIAPNIATATGNIVTEAAKYLYYAAGHGIGIFANPLTYDPAVAANNASLQDAIWSLVVKGNIGWGGGVNPATYVNSSATYLSAVGNATLAETYRNFAIAAVAAGAQQADNLALASRIYVLNPAVDPLNGAEAQSMVFEVPEPASLVVWSVLAGSAAGLTVARRKRRNAPAGRWSAESRSAIFAVVDKCE